MDWKLLRDDIWTTLSTPLVTIGDTQVSMATVLTVVVVLFITSLISRLVQRAVRRAISLRGETNAGHVAVICRLVHYMVLFVGGGIALETAGIDLSALFAAGAVFAVGIGFAMQNIAQNFVSGVILLTERAIKPGDVVEVEGRVVRVHKMGIRSAVTRTRDDEDLIVPNATLVQSTVKNYTMNDSRYRVRARVGVAYESDVDRVLEVLTDVAAGMPFRLKDHEPRVLLKGFGDSTIDFEVSVWMGDPWDAPRAVSEMNVGIWRGFKAAGIVIAFPQVDVHFDAPVTQALAALEKAA